ncbi:MAG: hypothetical protein ACOC97_02895 [Myxococcota bacterium]
MTLLRPWAPVLGSLLLAGSATGCVRPVDFDPTGDEYSIEGSWLLQHGTTGEPQPPTQANCDALGIAEVQLVLFPELTGGRFVDEMFRFPCSEGRFDTRDPGFPAEDPRVLKSGTFHALWLGLDAQGEEVGQSVRSELALILEESTHDALATEEGANVIVVPEDDPES